MSGKSIKSTAQQQFSVLCAPYHLYTHQEALAQLFPSMAARGWKVSILLPFTAVETVDVMTRAARKLGGVSEVHDFSSRILLAARYNNAIQRLFRAVALLFYFVRTALLLLSRRVDVLLLTSDLGGVSVRFVQLLARALGTQVFTLQTTLFLKVQEREDLKFSFRPALLHRLLSWGIFKRLFLFFGEVPGTFLADSHLGVQDEEIRHVCIEFGKRADLVRVCGSLQAAKILAARAVCNLSPAQMPHVLFLTECISERYGDELGCRYIDWMATCARSLAGKAVFSVRFHPRESEAYRRQFADVAGPACKVDASVGAVEAAASADLIVGAYSMLMFDAQDAGIRTVFLEVGEDPLGFYTQRRVPRANSADELIKLVTLGLNAPDSPSSSTRESAQDWAGNIIGWMAEVLEAAHDSRSS